MKFLEARKLASTADGLPALDFLIALSGTADPLLLWLKAVAAESGRSARPRVLPFNTLGQHVRGPAADEREVFVLLPWDLCPEADWRSGLPAAAPDLAALEAVAAGTATTIAARPDAAMLYVQAPIPPLSVNAHETAALERRLAAVAAAAGARLIGPEPFSMESYLRSGFPFGTDHLEALARGIVEAASHRAPPEVKVVVTDFDNVLWHGVVGEDGAEGVHQEPEGLGYPHFLYQTYLRTLKDAGVLLAGVTRNDADLAVAPLRRGTAALREDDFVAIVASYNAKSAQIAELADRLNLGLDSFLFIDDNPVELAEVSAALPAVRVEPFPAGASEMPAFLARLNRTIHRTTLTSEDRSRTELYRRRMEGVVPSNARGADIFEFLGSLDMRMTVRDRTEGERARAVQLINKTNQFNLNGIRRSDDEVGAMLAGGGRLLTVSLADRHGDHGEILAYLTDGSGAVRAFVLSCRVLQRRVEHAFFSWLAREDRWPVSLEFVRTERNEPIRLFLSDPAFAVAGTTVTADAAAFLGEHEPCLSLFQLEAQAPWVST